ncbi:MAG: DUF4010 domain-containing protein, partial [Planctomycetes bacterium]|nr:DUF4010 domain-containing protein [Planctomycetota bacterium]
ARGAPEMVGLAALVIAIASAVALARVVVEVAVVAPGQLRAMAPPLAVLVATLAVLAGGLWLIAGRERAEMPAQGNPAELKPALIFAALYALISLAVAASRDHFGSGALYGVAVLSGLTDMDAITLSTARLAEHGGIEAHTAWRVIMVAALANLVFKGAAAAVLGGIRLGARVGVAFLIVVAVGGALIWLWPDRGETSATTPGNNEPTARGRGFIE